MNDRDGFTEEELREFLGALVARGTLIVEGVEALRLLRKAIEEAIDRAGVYVEWDPRPSVARARLVVGAALGHCGNRSGVAARRVLGAH